MKLSIKILLGAALATASAASFAADLKVIGTIVPAACAPTFTGGDTIDFGNIPAGTLNVSTPTTLPVKSTTITVLCDAPTRFALTAVDNKATTIVPGINPIAGGSDAQSFGLGAVGGTNVGVYALQISTTTADGTPAQRIRSLDAGATWGVYGGLVTVRTGLLSIALTGTTVPALMTTGTMDIKVTAVVDKATNLPLANDVPLDGSATFEVTYL